MRRTVLWAVGALILVFAADGALAEEQGDDKARLSPPVSGTETASKATRQEPNLLAEPNRQAGVVDQQREQLRQNAREQMRQRVLQRRGGEAGLGRTLDANAPAGAKGRDEPFDKTIAGDSQRQQQLTTVEQQIAVEENKHRDRTARLNRIRELAQKQNDANAVARVDKLIGKDKPRYDAKMQRMKHRKDLVIEFSQRAAPPQGGADANKRSNQPQANGPAENK
jgi:hypothetical protein